MDNFPCQPQECTRFKSDWSFSNEAHDFLYAGRIYCVIILFTNAKKSYDGNEIEIERFSLTIA